jgi:hypothetical protein
MSADSPGNGLGLLPGPLSLGRDCACGALADSGSAECRKCRARARWARRRAQRSAGIGDGR